MELTGMQVLNAVVALNSFTDQPLYVDSALKLRRTRRSLSAEAEMVEEQRIAIVNQFSEKDEDGNPVPGDTEGTIKLSDPEAFTVELEALFKASMEIKVEPVSVAELGKDVKISTNALDLLMELEIITE